MLLILIGMIGFWSCAEEESEIHLFYGEWNVRESTWTIVNGKQGPIFFQFYLMELNSENCGTKYNLDKEETARIKWIFEEDVKERGSIERTGDHVLLSEQSIETEGLSNLGKDNLYVVRKLTEEEIILSRSVDYIFTDSTYARLWNLRMTKE